jgi:hypothetical protein
MLALLAAAAAPGLAAGGERWSTPADISGWFTFGEVAWLRAGTDGTQAAFWLALDPSLQGALWVRVRSAGGEWDTAENLSGWVSQLPLITPPYWNAGVAPDGTVWVVRTVMDSVLGMQVVADQHPAGGGWQTETLSNWATAVRSAELHIGPDGDLAAIWVECDTMSGDLAQGNCAVNVRPRGAGAPGWEATQKVDNSSAGVGRAHGLVGPGGLTVIIWTEAMAGNQWAAKARAYAPAASGWEPNPINVSGWLEPRSSSTRWLAQPVMGADGTFVAAWHAKTAPGALHDALFSSTRQAASGNWSAPPSQISAAHDADTLTLPLLAVGQGGTAVAAWEWEPGLGGKYAIFANARDPGGAWGTEAQVSSSWLDDVSLYDLDVWATDDTAVVLWGVEDGSRPALEDAAVLWSGRPPNGGGGHGGEGQLGSWYDGLTGAALALGSDGSAAAVWVAGDGSQPANQQANVLAANWPPGGPWGTPETLASGHKLATILREGLVIGQGGRPVSALWLGMRDVNPLTTPSCAIFYSEWAEWQTFLPVVLRNAP